jgi:hypothetical protein
MSFIITEEYNIRANSGALTGNIICDAREEMSQKPKSSKAGSTNIPRIIQVRMCKKIIWVSSATGPGVA